MKSIPICLAIAFAILAAFSAWQNAVIREQMATQAEFDEAAAKIVKAYISAAERAEKARAALSLCKLKNV